MNTSKKSTVNQIDERNERNKKMIKMMEMMNDEQARVIVYLIKVTNDNNIMFF